MRCLRGTNLDMILTAGILIDPSQTKRSSRLQVPYATTNLRFTVLFWGVGEKGGRGSCSSLSEYSVGFIISMQCNRPRSVAQGGSTKEPMGSTIKSN